MSVDTTTNFALPHACLLPRHNLLLLNKMNVLLFTSNYERGAPDIYYFPLILLVVHIHGWHALLDRWRNDWDFIGGDAQG